MLTVREVVTHCADTHKSGDTMYCHCHKSDVPCCMWPACHLSISLYPFLSSLIHSLPSSISLLPFLPFCLPYLPPSIFGLFACIPGSPSVFSPSFCLCIHNKYIYYTCMYYYIYFLLITLFYMFYCCHLQYSVCLLWFYVSLLYTRLSENSSDELMLSNYHVNRR